jgi:REP element-mobilizing transposase RayT
MKSIKGFSAREINKLLNRKGSIWQSESFDHIVRDEDELYRIINYVIMNPVKAGLVENWRDWNFTYVNKELFDIE